MSQDLPPSAEPKTLYFSEHEPANARAEHAATIKPVSLKPADIKASAQESEFIYWR